MLTESKTWNSHPSINCNLLKKFWTLILNGYKVESLEANSAACLPLHIIILKWKLIKIKYQIVTSHRRIGREPEHRSSEQPNLLNFLAWYWPGHHWKYQLKLIYIKKLIGAMPEVICKQSTINWTLMFSLVNGIHGGHIVAIRKIKNKIVWNNLTCFRNMMVWKFHLILCCWQLCIFCCFFLIFYRCFTLYLSFVIHSFSLLCFVAE